MIPTLGFTGSRRGMTSRQRSMVRNLVQELEPDAVCHGDCMGSDEEFHEIVIAGTKAHVFLYPGHDKHGESPTRAYCDGPVGRLTIFPLKPYLVRDGDIVKVSDAMIATPHQDHEVRRSGTWATIRRAREYKKTLYIVFPDGQVWDGNPF